MKLAELRHFYSNRCTRAQYVVMSVSVYMSVCLSVRMRISGIISLNSTKFSVNVTNGCGWRRCDMLCTSGFACNDKK